MKLKAYHQILGPGVLDAVLKEGVILPASYRLDVAWLKKHCGAFVDSLKEESMNTYTAFLSNGAQMELRAESLDAAFALAQMRCDYYTNPETQRPLDVLDVKINLYA